MWELVCGVLLVTNIITLLLYLMETQTKGAGHRVNLDVCTNDARKEDYDDCDSDSEHLPEIWLANKIAKSYHDCPDCYHLKTRRPISLNLCKSCYNRGKKRK